MGPVVIYHSNILINNIIWLKGLIGSSYCVTISFECSTGMLFQSKYFQIKTSVSQKMVDTNLRFLIKYYTLSITINLFTYSEKNSV